MNETPPDLPGKIYPDPRREPPDRMEASLRLICGAIAGLVLGAGVSLKWRLDLHWVLAFAVIGGVVCAAAALYFGDDFWWELFDRKSRF